MNKKLLAVAVGAALAASAAVSQADVKVYGVAHVSVDRVDADRTAGSEYTNDWNVADNSSRFGIKVSEDLGGGFTGLAQFEIFVDNTDTATASSTTCTVLPCTPTITSSVNANRDNFVGIGHKAAGNLLFGRRDTAMKDVGGIADLFYREQIGESRQIIHTGNGAPDARSNESVTFESAKFGPVSFKLQWFTEDSQTATYNNGFNANVRVDIKPVVIGVAYYVTEGTGASVEDTDGYRVAVKGDIGPVTLTGLYQQINAIGGVSGADASSYGVGAAFKFLGKNTVKAQYYVTNSLDNALPGIENGANMWAVGYDYNFSKTTVVYLAYAKLTNDASISGFVLGGNGHGETYATNVLGGEISGFSLGTRVAF
jgi:predicted porin